MLGSITLPKGALVPGGSEYQGPSGALDRYTTVVKKAGEVVKGAKNPYTSRDGHMFSFLDANGTMAMLQLKLDATQCST